MNKKERLLNAMKLKNVDRIPMMYRGTIPFSKKIMEYFGIGNKNDPISLVKHHNDLLNVLGADSWTMGAAQYFSTFIPNYSGSDYTYLDTSYFATLGITMGEKLLKKHDFSYLAILNSPLSKIDDPRKIKGFLTKKLDLFNYKNPVNVLVNNSHNSPYYKNEDAEKLLSYNYLKDNNAVISLGKHMVYPFMLCSYLRGMENFLLDLAGNIKMAEAIIGEVIEFLIEFNTRFISETSINGDIFASWDDIADQSGLMFSPKIFKKYYLPFWKKIISLTKSKNMLFSWHCCGNVNEVLPLMIDAGTDVFDVMQTSAKDMEINKFFKKFGRNICVQGGIDVQELLIFKKPQDIINEINLIKSLWKNSGGIIIGPSHEVLPETPIENVLAIYKSNE